MNFQKKRPTFNAGKYGIHFNTPGPVKSNCKTASPRAIPEAAFKTGLLAGSTKPDWFSGKWPAKIVAILDRTKVETKLQLGQIFLKYYLV